MMNKNNNTQRYVVETYCSWTEPKHQTTICDLAELKEMQNEVDEVIAIYELGKEVQLQMAVA
jgi:hypothetical protein